MWQTTYMHALSGENAVAEWAAGSSLRPFLDRLPEERKEAFRQAYTDAARPHYPRRADGTTLLPFQRLFIGGAQRLTASYGSEAIQAAEVWSEAHTFPPLTGRCALSARSSRVVTVTQGDRLWTSIS